MLGVVRPCSESAHRVAQTLISGLDEPLGPRLGVTIAKGELCHSQDSAFCFHFLNMYAYITLLWKTGIWAVLLRVKRGSDPL